MDISPFFGPLHIEQNLLICTGELVKGTGLGDVLKSAVVMMVGMTDMLHNREHTVDCLMHFRR